jgi:hypothetical protein
MPAESRRGPVRMGFERRTVRIPITDILPLRAMKPTTKMGSKYSKIAASIREVGIIEPPVVVRDKGAPHRWLLLDGHSRIEILKDLGHAEVDCLVSTDDEAFTYNKRINRLATIQEHRMVLNAIERGVSEERLARALNINVGSIKARRRLLDGICSETADLLRDRLVPLNSFWALKRMVPLRQIEAAELMIAANNYSVSYAKTLLAATPQSQLREPEKPKKIRGLAADQMALMEREMETLQRDFKLAEQTYGTDHLELTLASRYVSVLLGNARVVRYLAQRHVEILAEFQKIAEPAAIVS